MLVEEFGETPFAASVQPRQPCGEEAEVRVVAPFLAQDDEAERR